MKSQNAVVERIKPELTGDIRKMAANLLLALVHGEVKAAEAAVGAKLIEQINVSLYSEIKHMALLVQLGREAPELGNLPLYGTPRKVASN